VNMSAQALTDEGLLDLELELDLDEVEVEDVPYLPKISALLQGVDLDAGLWRESILPGVAIYTDLVPELTEHGMFRIHTKSTDGVGICLAAAEGRYGTATLDVAYDPSSPAPYRAVLDWYSCDGISNIMAQAETPEQLVVRASRGLYACDFGTRLARNAILLAALVARAQVECVPVRFLRRAERELESVGRKFAGRKLWW
jgi:hypothetical protein